MRIAQTIMAGFFLAIAFAIAGGLAWLAHPNLREWPLADGYSAITIGSPLGGLLGVIIWIAIKDKAWAPVSMIVLGWTCSFMAFPSFHEPRTSPDGWNALRAELTFYFGLTIFSGFLCILFAGIIAHVRARQENTNTKKEEQVGAGDAEEAV